MALKQSLIGTAVLAGCCVASLAEAASYDFNMLGGYGSGESSSTVIVNQFNETAVRDFNAISMPMLRTQAEVNLDAGFYFQGDYTYNFVQGGNMMETDVFTATVPAGAKAPTPGAANVKGNNAWDISAAAGYEFKIYEPNAQGYFHFIPLAGYAKSQQNVGFVHSMGTLPDKGSFHTNWVGPWLGSRMLFEFPSNLVGFFQFEYHFLDYDATSTYSNRATPILRGQTTALGVQSLSQSSDANGWSIDVGFDWSPHLLDLEKYANWYVRVDFRWQEYWASNNQGTERLTLMNGIQSVDNLHDATWDSLSGGIGIGVRF